MKNIVFCLFLLISLIGCASNKVEKSSLGKVYVTNTNRVDLLAADSIKKEIDDYYSFEGKFTSKGEEKVFSAIAYLHANSKEIDVILLNDFGTEIGIISFTGTSAIIDSKVFPKQLKAEYIILDLQNALAESELLTKHYKEYGLTFDEIKTNVTTQNGGITLSERSISKKKNQIETISLGNGSIIIKNHLRGYEFKLTKIEENQ